jgi:Dullard-like phosphatase family protein
MFNIEFRSSNKSSAKKLPIRPLKDICINISDSPVRNSSINSPRFSCQSRRSACPLKTPATPGTPRQQIPKTPKAIRSKIKSPSNYIFSTHNHSKKFSLTPKKVSSQKNIPTVNRNEKVDSLITNIRPTDALNKQKEHLFNTFQAIKIARGLREPTPEELLSKKVILAKRKGYEQKKTVLFDLDETLVHCVNTNETGHTNIDIDFPPGTTTTISVNIRPYVKELLSIVSKDFEVILFTASHKSYADKVIDYLDPEGAWVHHRLYRHNCILIDGIYVKDLRILCDRNIKDILIVDNAAYSFAFQITSGVPIISWYSDMQDKELCKLIEYLKVLAKVDDIRVVNRYTFHLDTFYEDYVRDFLNKINKENIN